jgi:glucosamine 6-phosphate synthetase-like amidotransferase/phosphosugar isomerase protein
VGVATLVDGRIHRRRAEGKLGEHRHFMLKEIYEQPTAIRDPPTMTACGTAFHACMVAK